MSCLRQNAEKVRIAQNLVAALPILLQVHDSVRTQESPATDDMHRTYGYDKEMDVQEWQVRSDDYSRGGYRLSQFKRQTSSHGSPRGKRRRPLFFLLN
jgi:hypothetical protein